MKINILKRLREEHMIMGKRVHVIKFMYSVKPYHYYKNDEDFNPEWGSYSYDNAKIKQRELILKSLAKIKAKHPKKYYLQRGYFGQHGKVYISRCQSIKAKILGYKVYKKLRV
ncbi:MAG: hypothetical protein ACOCVF_01080 [bacterium]